MKAVKGYFLTTVLLIFLIGIYFIFIKIGNTANDVVNLRGWAWIGADCVFEEGGVCTIKTNPIGWVSLSSNNPEITCENIPYGVRINISTGEISGAAWIGVGEDLDTTDCNTTENSVGWIYFDSPETPPCGQNGYPSDYCFPAKLVGNEIQGWAPIISKDHQGIPTTVTWVRFKGSNYRVNFYNNELEGFAWSGFHNTGGLGWIKFGATPTPSVAKLSVRSEPIKNVEITASPSQYSGTTDYLVTSTSRISATLTAPSSVGDYSFEGWSGCNSVSGTNCYVSVLPGENRVVIAGYRGPTSQFDLSVTSLDIRTFICKNRDFDLSFWNEYRSRNPGYEFAPSTTYATEFYNKVAKDTCPESQRNRPVEFSAEGTCLQGTCPPSRLRIRIEPLDRWLPSKEKETKTFETTYNSSYPKSIKGEDVFNKPYDYKVIACFVDNEGREISDSNNTNNCKEQSLRIFDYVCLLGFCTQNQRDIENPSPAFNFEPFMYKILQVFRDTDSPCAFYRNEICRARIGF